MTKFATLTTAQILAQYNAHAVTLGQPQVKRFSDRATAEKRLAKIETEVSALTPAPAVEEVKPGRVKKDGTPVAKRGMRFILPVAAKQKAPREGTYRHTLFAMMSTPEGATFEELFQATWANNAALEEKVQRRTTYEGIRLLHFYNGFGLRQDEQGRITVYARQHKLPA